MINAKICWARGDVVTGRYTYTDDTGEGFEMFLTSPREGEMSVEFIMTIVELREFITVLTDIANGREAFIKAKQAEYVTKDCSNPRPPRPSKD